MFEKGANKMKVPKAFFVVSNWNNDVSWIKDYTNNFVIYDKSNTLPPSNKVIKIPNVGYNIHDILHFIINNYDNLPELTAFLEGNPFDHCKRETFDKLIYNTKFTAIEDYSHITEDQKDLDHVGDAFIRIGNTWKCPPGDKTETRFQPYKRSIDGGYMEINSSWYVFAHRRANGFETAKYFEFFGDFLYEMFDIYRVDHPKWIRFAPGAQYIVPKENILFYSKYFYEKLIGYVDYHRIPAEAHLLERATYSIFTNRWKERIKEKKC